MTGERATETRAGVPRRASSTDPAVVERVDRGPRDLAAHRCPLQVAAVVIGSAFLLVGIAGFVPGVTTDLGDLEFAGHESGAQLFGVFQVSVLHNFVHLAFGVLGLAAARALPLSRRYFVAGGLAYLALWASGLLVERTSDANIVPLNRADDWLHLVLGTGMLLVAAALWRHQHDRTSRAAAE